MSSSPDATFVYTQVAFCVLAVAAAFSSAAAQITETAVGADGKPATYPVSVDYSSAAASAGVEAVRPGAGLSATAAVQASHPL